MSNKEIEIKISAVEDKVDSTVILRLAKAIKDLLIQPTMTLSIGYGSPYDYKDTGFRVTNWFGSNDRIYVSFKTAAEEPFDDLERSREEPEHKAWREAGESFVFSKVKLAIDYINSTTTTGDKLVVVKDGEDYKIVNTKFAI